MGDCGQKWAWDSNFNEWINLAEFLDVNTYFRKLNVIYFNSYWVGMVKYESVLLGYRTPKSAYPNSKINQ